MSRLRQSCFPIKSDFVKTVLLGFGVTWHRWALGWTPKATTDAWVFPTTDSAWLHPAGFTSWISSHLPAPSLSPPLWNHLVATYQSTSSLAENLQSSPQRAEIWYFLAQILTASDLLLSPPTPLTVAWCSLVHPSLWPAHPPVSMPFSIRAHSILFHLLIRQVSFLLQSFCRYWFHLPPPSNLLAGLMPNCSSQPQKLFSFVYKSFTDPQINSFQILFPGPVPWVHPGHSR